MVKGKGSCGKDLKHAQCLAEMPQRSNQDRTHAQAAAASKVYVRIAFRIMTQQYFTRTHTLCRNTGVGLQVNAEIGGGAASTCPADDLIPLAQSDGRSGSAGECLSALGNHTDAGLQIQLAWMEFEPNIVLVHFGRKRRGAHHTKVVATGGDRRS